MQWKEEMEHGVAKPTQESKGNLLHSKDTIWTQNEGWGAVCPENKREEGASRKKISYIKAYKESLT